MLPLVRCLPSKKLARRPTVLAKSSWDGGGLGGFVLCSLLLLLLLPPKPLSLAGEQIWLEGGGGSGDGDGGSGDAGSGDIGIGSGLCQSSSSLLLLLSSLMTGGEPLNSQS